MASRYWVGTDQNWHDPTNWAATSGGPGGAGVPTASDDVYFDGNGNTLCWPSSDIVCNNLSLLTGMTEYLVVEANAVIHGDFFIEAGYFGATGGPNYTIEFKGDWLNTGGTFSIGTGAGKDPECIFSGIGKTYTLNSLSAASFQNVLISGEITLSGSRLAVMTIQQKLSVTGTMTINKNGTLICRVDLTGVNAGFDTLSGTITGTGRFWFRYKDTDQMPSGGEISIRYFRFYMDTAVTEATLQPRTWLSPCEVELEYTADGQAFRLGGGERHYFMNKLTLHCDVSPSFQHTALFDCDTNTAEMWVNGIFNIYKNAFPAHIVTIKFGDGIHVFRGSIDFYFSYSSGASTQLVVDPGEGTLILWPRGGKQIVKP
ncbi:MAG: hypothetical protein DRP56_03775 [Planctomycetota bacterium]|nr:MAG: hypothetical protein DRP56_03775 [Planctomycetota bacterium]